MMGGDRAVELRRSRSNKRLDWARAFTPGQLRAVAFLHEAYPKTNYSSILRLVSQSEVWRTAQDYRRAVRVLTLAGIGRVDAQTAVYAMTTPGRSVPIGDLDPHWASLSTAAKETAWRYWLGRIT